MFSLPLQKLKDLGFNEREVQKVISFGSIISPFLKHSNKKLIDLCSGKGLCAFSFHYNGLIKKSLSVDVRETNCLERTRKLFEEYGFDNTYIHKDITSKDFSLPEEFKENSGIVSIHPCSELADRVIEIGLANNLSFALMTCCHKTKSKEYTLKDPPDPRLMLYDEPADYFDLVRQRYIEEQGWNCHRFEVPKKITKKNHILIGISPDRNQ